MAFIRRKSTLIMIEMGGKDASIVSEKYREPKKDMVLAYLSDAYSTVSRAVKSYETNELLQDLPPVYAIS